MTTGMNAATGRSISDWDHLVQSLGIIFTTALRTRAMRRDFGAGLPRRVDAPISPNTLLDFYSDVAKALVFEPRFKASQIAIDGSNAASGQLVITAAGLYYPNALKGDFSVVVPQTAVVPITP